MDQLCASLAVLRARIAQRRACVAFVAPRSAGAAFSVSVQCAWPHLFEPGTTRRSAAMAGCASQGVESGLAYSTLEVGGGRAFACNAVPHWAHCCTRPTVLALCGESRSFHAWSTHSVRCARACADFLVPSVAGGAACRASLSVALEAGMPWSTNVLLRVRSTREHETTSCR